MTVRSENHPFRGRFNDSKSNAKRRNIAFSLTFEEYVALRQGCCAYGTKEAGGIDRKDSNLDYSIDNCIPCCFRHNMIKSSVFTHEEMLRIVQVCNSAKACGSLTEARAQARAKGIDGMSKYQSPTLLS